MAFAPFFKLFQKRPKTPVDGITFGKFVLGMINHRGHFFIGIVSCRLKEDAKANVLNTVLQSETK